MQIVIEGVAPHIDGSYELPEPLTTRELHEVKQQSDVRPFEFAEAYRTGDAAFKAVMAVIALRRVGKVCPIDLLLDLPFDKSRFMFPELKAALEAEANTDPTNGSPTGNSGTDGLKNSVSPEDDPKASGEPTSPTSAEFEPATSAT